MARACGLYRESNGERAEPTGVSVEKATKKLGKRLFVTPVRKSSLIMVSYTSPDRGRSVLVLNELAREYLAKHTTLHTADTAAKFFTDKSVAIQEQLDEAERQRAEVVTANGYALLPLQQQMTVQQMLDERKAKDDADASIAEAEGRLSVVMQEQRVRTPRIVTQLKSSANQYTVEQLTTLLANLENKRTELATKFLAGDRLLVEADEQIAQTRAALERARSVRSDDETTDVNPLRQALDAEAIRGWWGLQRAQCAREMVYGPEKDQLLYHQRPCFGCELQVPAECPHGLMCMTPHTVDEMAVAVRSGLAARERR